MSLTQNKPALIPHKASSRFKATGSGEIRTSVCHNNDGEFRARIEARRKGVSAVVIFNEISRN
jgi:hypothetical protein